MDYVEIKLKACEIAIQNGTKAGMDKNACLTIADKIYKYVTGKTNADGNIVLKEQKHPTSFSPGNRK